MLFKKCVQTFSMSKSTFPNIFWNSRLEWGPPFSRSLYLDLPKICIYQRVVCFNFRPTLVSEMKLVIPIALILITGQSVNSKKIADCDCNCEDTAFYDVNSNLHMDPITLKGGDADSCKSYCKKEFPGAATYFAWVDDTFEDAQGNPAKDFHNSCWCKKETDVDGEKRTGVTTGKVKCEGMHL